MEIYDDSHRFTRPIGVSLLLFAGGVHLSDNKMTIMAIRSSCCCCCCCWGCMLPVVVVVVTYVVHVHVIAAARCATKCIQLDFFPILPLTLPLSFSPSLSLFLLHSFAISEIKAKSQRK